ncbi:MAG: stage II sporulation protein D [Oscillospiraceae bacterium]|nr:stage II sporulation protein D [Oscillospiraceae bacterium]
MSKFRAAVIAITLTIMFFVPVSAIKQASAYPDESESQTQNESSESEPQEGKIPENEPAETEEKAEGVFRIYDLENEKILEVSYSDYVKGAIASEMGADFEFEALVAQGVAAFSCGLYQKEAHFAADYDFSAAPDKKLGYMTEEKAKEVYGEAFEEKWGIISSAAEKAMQYILTYESEPALAVYHAVSAGMTESSENAWGGEIPYLVSVESEGDALCSGYETTVEVSRESALEILNKNGAGLSGAVPEEWFEGAVLTDAGYVDYIQIGAATFSGERLRSLFGLRSTAFDVSYKGGEFVFTVRGYGHGVGLSQVGANYMAENGAAFEEILAHYYPGTVLSDYGDIY